ncbi:Calcium load-activated calcium channel [Plasmodiophora brassicae]|uniref:Calcium load-activated calcium channel n=1 Tax=Plasmodiophora brassicae TaxID=37360 RepID=A0A0G4IPH2_PLABS|nr:hypothetical protein PBRA_005673 [Plasmodiophora brassicae]SPR01049.1 unnamed protein product [Plasmodiophora brassicae]
MYGNAVIVVFSSLLSAVLSEAVSWVMIYRTSQYRSLSKDIDRLNAKLEKAKEKHVSIASKKSKDKQVSFYEEQLKAKSRDLTMAKFKSGFVVMFIMLSMMALLNNEFDGRVIAKLPFTPIPLIRGLSHRNLPGTDFTDCSMAFLYVLCSMSFRTNLQKALGFAPPKTAMSIFTPPTEK